MTLISRHIRRRQLMTNSFHARNVSYALAPIHKWWSASFRMKHN